MTFALAFGAVPAVGRRPYSADVQATLDQFATDVNTALNGLPVVSGAALIVNALGEVGWDYVAVRTNLNVFSKSESDAQYAAIGTQILPGTGLTGGGDFSVDRTLTLADTAVTPGTYGDATHVMSATVDQQGRITAASSVSISAAGLVTSVNTRSGAVTGLAEDSTVVHLTGSETVAGVKTFSSAPVVPTNAFPESAVASLVSDLAGKLSSTDASVTNARTPTAHAATHLPGQSDQLLDNRAPLRRFRQSLAIASTTPLRVLIHGDSIVEGVGASTVPKRWVNLLKDQITAFTGASSPSLGSISVIPQDAGTGPLSGLWSGDAGTLGSDGLGARSWKSAAGSTNHRTITLSCDRFQVHYNKGSALGAFTITVDGGSPVTVDCHQSAAGPTMTVWDSVTDGSLTLTGGSHTIVLTTVNTGTVATYATNIATLVPFYGNFSSGVQLYEAGHSGFPMYVPSGQELAQIALVSPDVVFLCAGVNDLSFGGNPALTASNYAAAVTAIAGAVSHPVSFVFVDMWGNGTDTEAHWQPFHDAIAAQALTTGAALVDLYESVGWQGASTVISADHTHPNDAGQQVFADIIGKTLGASWVSQSGGAAVNGFSLYLPGDLIARASIGLDIGGKLALAFSDGQTTGSLQELQRTSSSLWTLANARLSAAFDSASAFQDHSDPTKQATFALSGISTATIRTFTLPDASGIVALTAAPTFTTSVDVTFAGAGNALISDLGSNSPAFQVRKTAGDTNPDAELGFFLGAPAVLFGDPAADTAFDAYMYRSGAAALTIVGTLTVPSPVITGHATIEGVVLTGKTGTGKLVLDTTPTLTTSLNVIGAGGGNVLLVDAGSNSPGVQLRRTPADTNPDVMLGYFLGFSGVFFADPAADTAFDAYIYRSGATALTVSGTLNMASPTITGHATIEGTALTGKTGTGNLVLSASPTLSGTLAAAAATFSSTIAVTGHATLEGVTSTGATGTGALVFSASPTFTGTLTAATAALGATTSQLAGVNAQTANYTAVLGDASKLITMNKATAVTLTIPANASVAYPIGTVLYFVNIGVGALTLAITTDTLTGTTAYLTNKGGYAVKAAATTWYAFATA